MTPLVLYCKSYRTDVKRVARLAQSVAKFNTDKIPFYVSAPKADIHIFEDLLKDFDVKLISDESIIALNPAISQVKLNSMHGGLSQQVVKSEFWRTGVSQTYLCLDSDCVFIRPFSTADFLTADGVPYTIMDEGRDLLYAVLSRQKKNVIANFHRESSEVQQEFGRQGKHYNFGPNCPIWDARVWASLDEKYSQPRGLSFLDLVLKSPNEQRWYGEALLKYKAIDLLPSQPLFKMYHYAWQQKFDRQVGIKEEQLKQIYCGVVYQSAWEREMDWPNEGGNFLSRMARRLRRVVGRA